MVRKLKSDGAPHEEVMVAVEQLKKLKVDVENEEKKYSEPKFDKEGFDSILLRRMIVVPAFEIYGGEKGLFDLGPEGTALMENITSVWRKHFVLKENMLQLTATCLTPEVVLKTSGHVDRFQDLMCKDLTTGSCFRADKLLEDHIDNMLLKPEIVANVELREEIEQIHRKADAYSPKELDDLIRNRFKIRSPESGTELSEPFPFNLMFGTSIGPEGSRKGYLRPETAQGIFVNFKRLLERKGGKMPFGCAQIGLGFRNEISPRAGLVRVREFLMAEIEHFVDPNDKSHKRFNEIKDVRVTLFTKENQLGNGRLISAPIGLAVEKGIVANETLAYFIARTYQFLIKIGINPDKLRFRQHLDTQMAHYACDCWDGEINMSYGWVECVGLADRSCYDLKVHSEATKISLTASRHLSEPKVVKVAKAKINKGLIGKKFKKEAAILLSYFDEIQENNVEEALRIEDELNQSTVVVNVDGNSFEVDRKMVSFTESEKTIHSETYYPHVIEPSFGMGRIFYAALEHSFYNRDEDTVSASGTVNRAVLGFNPRVAPIKVAVFPLQNKNDYVEKVNKLVDNIVEFCDFTVDSDVSSVSIGKRYARMDEIGVPFTITVDQDTLAGKGPTVRERDSSQQIRVVEEKFLETIAALVQGRVTWQEVTKTHELL